MLKKYLLVVSASLFTLTACSSFDFSNAKYKISEELLLKVLIHENNFDYCNFGEVLNSPSKMDNKLTPVQKWASTLVKNDFLSLVVGDNYPFIINPSSPYYDRDSAIYHGKILKKLGGYNGFSKISVRTPQDCVGYKTFYNGAMKKILKRVKNEK